MLAPCRATAPGSALFAVHRPCAPEMIVAPAPSFTRFAGFYRGLPLHQRTAPNDGVRSGPADCRIDCKIECIGNATKEPAPCSPPSLRL